MSYKARILLLALGSGLLSAATYAQQPPDRHLPPPPPDVVLPEPAHPEAATPQLAFRTIDWQTIELGPEHALSMEPIDLVGRQLAALKRLLMGEREVRRKASPRSARASSTPQQGPYRAILLPAGRPDLVVSTAAPNGEDGLWFLADVGLQAHIMAKLTASILWVQPATTNGLNDLVTLHFVRQRPMLAYLRYNGHDYVELGTDPLLPCPIIPGLFHPGLCLPNGRALQIPQEITRPSAPPR